MSKISSRCKARVSKVEKNAYGEGYMIALGSPPYDPDPESENGKFFEATPAIQMQLGLLNEGALEAFPEGKDVYVTFTPVED